MVSIRNFRKAKEARRKMAKKTREKWAKSKKNQNFVWNNNFF